MKLVLLVILALSFGGCLVIDDDDDEGVRYYRPGSRYVARPYVERQQYYVPGHPRGYRGRPYVAPAEAYDDRRYLDRRRYRDNYDD